MLGITPLTAAEPNLAEPRPMSGSRVGQGKEPSPGEISGAVETNSLAQTSITNAAIEQKSFHWRTAWQGWDGLHTEIAQRTSLPHPLTSARQKLGTNVPQVFHLEELKMTGKIGAKVAVDAAAAIAADDFADFDGGVELRRARIYGKGDCLLVLPVSYELEIGYIPHQFYIENSYLAFKGLGWLGELKMGHFQPSMAFDSVASARDVTFMETAAPLQALAPGASAGTQIGRAVQNDRATWKFGLFTEGVGRDLGDASRDYGRAVLRLTALPHWASENNSEKLLHLGLSANILYSDSSTVRYRSRPESHLAPYLIDTGEMDAEGALVAGLEVAWVDGPLSIQGEYLRSWVRQASGDVPQLQGLYCSASWFLTGESRPYSKQEGIFGRVKPRRDFSFGRHGWGAWELAARASFTDLDSGAVNGGWLAMLMGGVNWYLHSHVKCRFDYGFGHVSARTPDGNLHIFQTRVELDF